MRRIRSMVVSALLFAVAAALAGAGHAAEPARIAAASDLRFAMDKIVAAFREDHPDHPVEVIYGSSGRFRAQIENGAPFDLYFSADIAYPRMLVERGFAATEVIRYGVGRIVLWSGTVDATRLTLGDLTRPEFRRIAIANPSHAPYGARAREALRTAGLWDELEPRLVYGENIAHAMQLVESGAADIGIIALALALNDNVRGRGGYYLIDDALHQPLDQGFIITRRAAENETARLFADYMQAPAARAVMREYGFMLPGE